MTDLSPYLILGCFGRTEDGFTLCSGTENRVLKLDSALVESEKIWAYLDGVQLLDKPMLNFNAIKHLIFNLQDKFDQKTKNLWTQTEFRRIERFLIMHKECGVFARLLVVEPVEDSPPVKMIQVSQPKVSEALRNAVRKRQPTTFLPKINVPNRRSNYR